MTILAPLAFRLRIYELKIDVLGFGRRLTTEGLSEIGSMLDSESPWGLAPDAAEFLIRRPSLI